jgi:hypothetical protein
MPAPWSPLLRRTVVATAHAERSVPRGVGRRGASTGKAAFASRRQRFPDVFPRRDSPARTGQEQEGLPRPWYWEQPPISLPAPVVTAAPSHGSPPRGLSVRPDKEQAAEGAGRRYAALGRDEDSDPREIAPAGKRGAVPARTGVGRQRTSKAEEHAPLGRARLNGS